MKNKCKHCGKLLRKEPMLDERGKQYRENSTHRLIFYDRCDCDGFKKEHAMWNKLGDTMSGLLNRV